MHSITRGRLRTALALLFLLGLTPTARADRKSPFFLHDGDTVVFYGDSITEQQMYGRDIEDYVVTRFPKMHVKFINSGWSGDKVTGGGGGNIELRLKRDVLNYKPTVVTLFLGMNDGGYTTDNAQNYQAYTTGLAHIVDELTQQLPGVRLTLLTPSLFDYNAKDRQPPTAGHDFDYGHPAPDYNQTLLRYGDFVKKLGASRHIPVADLNAPMAAATAQGRLSDPHFALSGDGVHPNDIGHLIMAAAVLQAWHAPGGVADVTLSPGKTVTLNGPLPWPTPPNAQKAFALSPLPGSLDIFRLRGRKLSTTNYTLLIDGQPAGMLTREQLTAGVDLTQNPDLPENKQAQTVAAIINDRITQWHEFFKGRQAIAHADDVPTAEELSKLQAEDTALDALRVKAHDAALPQPHTFALRPVAP